MNDYFDMYSTGMMMQEIRADARFIPKRSMVLKNKRRAARQKKKRGKNENNDN